MHYIKEVLFKRVLSIMALALLLLPISVPAQDDMLGEIRIFAGTFCPRGWMDTDGSLLPIKKFPSLYSLLRNNFGGDGNTTFALPDLRGRVAVGAGTGPGLSPYTLGQSGGSEQVTLGINEMPDHAHSVSISENVGDGSSSLASGAKGDHVGQSNAVLPSGKSQPHENRPPFLVVRYCICVDGRFPERP